MSQRYAGFKNGSSESLKIIVLVVILAKYIEFLFSSYDNIDLRQMLDKPVFFIILGFLLVGSIFYFELRSEKTVWYPSEKETIASLMEIYNANWKWKNADPDGNNELDFWAKDIAGLYYYPDSKSGKRVKLISYEIATADSRAFPSFYHSAELPLTPRSGYFFRMMLLAENGFYLAHEDEATKKKYRNLSHFCLVAYPALNKRLRTFIINEKREIYYRQTVDDEIIDRWPKNPLEDGWLPLGK